MINFQSESEATLAFTKLQSLIHTIYAGNHQIKIIKVLASIKEKNDSDDNTGSDPPNSEKNQNSGCRSKED